MQLRFGLRLRRYHLAALILVLGGGSLVTDQWDDANGALAGVFVTVCGLAALIVVERRRRRIARADLVEDPQGIYTSILVPIKLNLIGDELLVTALRLAEEEGAAVHMLHVIEVPYAQPLEQEAVDEAIEADRHIRDGKALAAELGVEITASIVRHREIGSAIVEEAERQSADLVLMGSSSRWRRLGQSFSPSAQHVMRRANCQVMVVSYPEGQPQSETDRSADDTEASSP